MILRHYSKEPTALDLTRVYDQGDQTFKPVGLWLSVVGDADWKQWCEDSEYFVAGLAHSVDLELVPGANVLTISTADALRAFAAKYKTRTPFPYDREINWARVIAEYGGIVIAPYQWECRLESDLFWYYSWDCASACVWDLSTVRLATREEVAR